MSTFLKYGWVGLKIMMNYSIIIVYFNKRFLRLTLMAIKTVCLKIFAFTHTFGGVDY